MYKWNIAYYIGGLSNRTATVYADTLTEALTKITLADKDCKSVITVDFEEVEPPKE